MAATRYTKEILLADERNRNVSAVVRYGPHLFLSSSDGHRDIVTEQVEMGVAIRMAALDVLTRRARGVEGWGDAA